MKKVLIILAVILMLLTFTSCDSSTSPGNQIEYGEMTDIDGNTYKTIQIGNQVWMAENLRVTHFRNGEPVIEYTEDMELTSDQLKEPACYSYRVDVYNEYFGKLYNWYAADDERGLAPEGWRIPSEEDYQILVDYLGGEDYAAPALREGDTRYWDYVMGECNESGFSGRGGGYMAPNTEPDWTYSSIKQGASFLTSTEMNSIDNRNFGFGYYGIKCTWNTSIKYKGRNIRCIKN